MLVGNKVDLENQRQVSTEDGKAFADKHGMEFLETSAADEVNIDQTFRDMAKQILEYVSKNETNGAENNFKKLLENKTKKISSNKCCSAF